MAETLPQFDAPPVVETLISVQFSPLPGFTAAMVGWFWKSYLDAGNGKWSKTQETAPLADQFEQFGPDGGWAVLGLQFLAGTLLSGKFIGPRIQIIRSDEERMVQVQASRLVLNWKRGTGAYPSYGALLSEFETVERQFSEFTHDAGYEQLSLNTWEIAYVNHLFRDQVWSDFDDLEKIFVDARIPKAMPVASRADTAGWSWRFIIGENLGRLYVTFTHGRVPPNNREALVLQITARGPLASSDRAELRRCLDLGHEAIVRTFVAITTPAAHKIWKRTQ